MLLPKTTPIAPPTKCLFTRAPHMPGRIDESSLPRNKKPFSTLISLTAIHTVTLLLPTPNLHEDGTFERHLRNSRYSTPYAKVLLSLSDILTGDFFTDYVKKGDVLLLSSGRAGIDNLYSLSGGILRLELDKATYERCGLQGNPIPDGGIKHKRSRFAIEINLRLPSMLSGKKGFERVKYAARAVLTETRTWLFYNFGEKKHESKEKEQEQQDDVLEKHHPLWKTSEPVVTAMDKIRVPPLGECTNGLDENEVEEWLALCMMGSTRIRLAADVDPFLCRYHQPTIFNADEEFQSRKRKGGGGIDQKGAIEERRDVEWSGERIGMESSLSSSEENVLRIQWHGFIPPQFITRIMLLARRHTGPGEWWTLNVASFHHGSVSYLRPPAPRLPYPEPPNGREEQKKEQRLLEWFHPPSLVAL